MSSQSNKQELFNDFTQFMRTVPLLLLKNQAFSVFANGVWQTWPYIERASLVTENGWNIENERTIIGDTNITMANVGVAPIFRFNVNSDDKLEIIDEDGNPLMYRDELRGSYKSGEIQNSVYESQNWQMKDRGWSKAEYPEEFTGTDFPIVFRGEIKTSDPIDCTLTDDIPNIECYHEPGKISGLIAFHTPLSSDILNSFLTKYPKYITKCCNIGEYGTDSEIRTNFCPMTSGPSDVCDAHMKTWCADVGDHSASETYKPECACFSAYPNENREIVKSIEGILGSSALNKCLIPECETKMGYKTSIMLDGDCTDLCSTIQDTINDKPIDNPKNVKSLSCADIEVMLPENVTDESFPWGWVGLGIGIFVLILAVILFLALRQKRNIKMDSVSTLVDTRRSE